MIMITITIIIIIIIIIMIINVMVYFSLPVEVPGDLTLTSVLLFAEIFEFVTEWLQKKS